MPTTPRPRGPVPTYTERIVFTSSWEAATLDALRQIAAEKKIPVSTLLNQLGARFVAKRSPRRTP